jgi:hypothetical protein
VLYRGSVIHSLIDLLVLERDVEHKLSCSSNYVTATSLIRHAMRDQQHVADHHSSSLYVTLASFSPINDERRRLPNGDYKSVCLSHVENFIRRRHEVNRRTGQRQMNEYLILPPFCHY